MAGGINIKGIGRHYHVLHLRAWLQPLLQNRTTALRKAASERSLIIKL